MFYDTRYRHDQALQPDGLETLPAALHALNAAADDCRRAGKHIDRDAAVILLIRNLADVAQHSRPSATELRSRCVADRAAVMAAPALLDIAGHSVAGDPAAKRTFHHQARRGLARLAEAIGLDPDTASINSALGTDQDDGATELRHADIGIRVKPRGLLPNCEISFNRCVGGEPAGKLHLAPIAELLDPAAFARRLSATIGTVNTLPLAACTLTSKGHPSWAGSPCATPGVSPTHAPISTINSPTSATITAWRS